MLNGADLAELFPCQRCDMFNALCKVKIRCFNYDPENPEEAQLEGRKPDHRCEAENSQESNSFLTCISRSWIVLIRPSGLSWMN